MMSASSGHGASTTTRLAFTWSQGGYIGSVTSCSFLVLIASLLLLLPGAMRSEESEVLTSIYFHPGSKIVLNE